MSANTVDFGPSFSSMQHTLSEQNLRIMSWNIHGDLGVMLTDPICRKLLFSYDICLLQETHLLQGQEDSLNIPPNFSIVCNSRGCREDLGQPGGGVAIVYRTSLPIKLCPTLSRGITDILVAEIYNLRILCAYVPPESAPWHNWTTVDPWVNFTELVSLCAVPDGKTLLVAGDLNARTCSSQSAASPNLVRLSQDRVRRKTRGILLLELSAACNLTILNGSKYETDSPGLYTSHQWNGSSVIDYMLVTMPLGATMTSLGWSDHCALGLTLAVTATMDNTATQMSFPVPALLPNSLPVPSAHPSHLDLLLIATLEASMSDADALKEIYGTVNTVTVPTIVYTDGSCLKPNTPAARAGAGIYWGEASSENTALRVPGAPTNNRAELYAVLWVLTKSSDSCTLYIFTDSTYVIHSICHWAPNRAARGWVCTNSDILKDIVAAIAARGGATHFFWVQGHTGNVHNEAADALAKKGAMLEPHVLVYSPPLCRSRHKPATHTGTPLLDTPKVYTSLPAIPVPGEKPMQKLAEIPADNSKANKGRVTIQRMQRENLQSLVSCRNDVKFWKHIRGWLDPKKRPTSVSLEQIRLTFENRMNPPEVLPESFDQEAHARFERIARIIPATTTDRSSANYFSRPFSLAELEEVQRRIAKHPGKSATGPDGISYGDIAAIKNADLLILFQQCIDSAGVPSAWLSTLVCAILKRGKPADNPESYRLIALESCLLKTLTLLIALRFREWMSDENIIPHSQNGFREGYRTNNNSFILRCAIDKARSMGKPLYICFVDCTNAFPATHRPTLWAKLYARGVGGPLFDWLRVLYSDLRYQITMDGLLSPEFSSMIGVLTGDSASPDLWNAFMSDFCPPADEDDVNLGGVPLGAIIQADDVALPSLSPRGLQRKMNYMWDYSAVTFLVINMTKTLAMIQGPIPRNIMPFTLNGKPVNFTNEYSYVGMTFVSDARNIFAKHYARKEISARSIANVTFSVESFVGSLPPFQGKRLYNARVDPHLTAGCEVALDVDMALLKPLQKVQHTYMQRLIGLNPRAMRAFCFSETGVLPLAYRRIILAVRYLKYVLARPPHHLVACALRECELLYLAGAPSWLGDLAVVINRIPTYWTRPLWSPLGLDVEAAALLIEDITMAAKLHVQDAIDDSSKGLLLHGRLHTDENGDTVTEPIAFRLYLSVTDPRHRKALASLLLADSLLAEAQLRLADPRARRKKIPRDWRLCRFCMTDVEDPLHALFSCDGSSDLIALRTGLWLKCGVIGEPMNAARTLSPNDILQRMLLSKRLVPILAEYSFNVLKVFELADMFIASEAYWIGQDGGDAKRATALDVML